VATEDVSRGLTPGQVPEGPGRSETEERVDGETFARRSVVACRSERVRADERTLPGPPESGLPPAPPVADGHDLEGRAGDAGEGDAVKPRAQPLREGGTVALVAVEELDDPGRLAERAHPILDAVSVHRVDEPHASLEAERVGRALHERGLGGDPAEAEVRLVAEADVHSSVLPLESLQVRRYGCDVSERGRGRDPREVPMKAFRTVVALGVAALVSAAPAGAVTDLPHPHEFKKRGHHWQAGMEPGPPGPAPAMSPRAKNAKVETLGHHDPGGPSGDVVAYGRFAYLGSWGLFTEEGEFCRALGVRVHDIKNPRNPRHVSTFADGASNPELAGSWTEKVIVRHVETPWFDGNLAVVSFQDCRPGGFTGIGLYDVTKPRKPKELSLRQSGIFGVHELWLERRGNRAYVYEAAIFEEVIAAFDGEDPEDVNPEFRIVDVSDPRNPVQIGDWSIWRDRGISPLAGIGSFPFNFVHSVVVFKKIAYVSYWDAGTVLLDVRNPANPRFISRTKYGEGAEGNAHSAWTAKDGRLLIQTDEDFDPVPGPDHDPPMPDLETGWGYAHFFDIRNKRKPKELATFKLPSTHQFPPPGPGDFTVHDPKVRWNRLYLSWYTEGVVKVDISKSANPRFVGQWIPPEIAEDPLGVFFPGEEYAEVWGVFPHRSYVLASDMNTGLWVFRIRG